MTNREVIFRGGVSKLDKPKGQRPSEARPILKASTIVNKQTDKAVVNK
ncbi:hypothetical protein [Desulfosporosinus sp. BICA1-9]|nr:hypothetical protein [Desulfosporosinus sp. BICA1-9]